MLDVAKPTIPDVLPQVEAYLAMPGNNCGGSLHIVLDDCNIADAHVEFCRQEAIDSGDDAGRALAEVLLRMSKTQRSKLARIAWRA